jgi:putative CocE/NonD family hydrolase
MPSSFLLRIAITSAIAAVAAPVAAQTQPAPEQCAVQKEINVAATMRDGTVLYADVYRPVESGSYPVLLMRLPYDKSAAQSGVYGPPSGYAARCYIVVIQDLRGLYTSEGTFYPFRDELDDGYDSVEWAAGLPQSNGKVGMYGFSYVGATQWLAAIKAPPHLAAIAPAHTGSDYYDGWSYEGGAFSLAFEESWALSSLTAGAVPRLGDQSVVDKLAEARGAIAKSYTHLPIRTYPWLMPDRPEVAGFFFDWVKHSDRDEYWRRWSIRERWPQVKVPALNFAGWYDVFLNGSVENFVGMRKSGGSDAARNGQRLVIRPYVHIPWDTKSGDVDFGPEAANTTMDQQLRFFDYWLKGKNNGADKDAPVRVFVMGANVWREAQDWPIPGTRFTKFYLHSRGQANSSFGNGQLTTEPPVGAEPSDHYVYDPANPVPSKGGHSCCFATVAPVGPYDQTDIEKRADVLIYSTPPLSEAVEVTGPITVKLFAASSAPDTDWTAKLVDVAPGGKIINLNNGIVRASHRNGLEAHEPIDPGKPYGYTITVFPTSNLFKVGHQIRLEISSSNFPHYDRNLNTGQPVGSDAQMIAARQTVFHDSAHPSYIELPIMPAPIRTASGQQ